MGETDFYKLLGIGRSASADQIKVAYRELVKKHHPDLFTAVSEKAKATEKLRLINEAYAVLGNPERRHRYDAEFVQKQRPRAPAAAARRKAPRPRPRQAEVRRKTLKMPKLCLRFSKKWAGYSLAAAAAILLLIYAGRSVPRLVTAWVLMEKLEISPPRNISPPVRAGEGWVLVAQFASVSNCATAIKEKVRQDEQEGSRAVYDEQNGTMAITVYVKKENAEALEDVNLNAERERAAAVEDASKNEQRQLERHATAESTDSFSKSGMTRRVRSLECRVTQRLETESRLRRALQKIGLFA